MAKKGKLVSWLEYIPARLVLDLLALMPRDTAVWTGIRIARMVFRIARGLRTTGERNLRTAFPELTESERSQILKASFDNLGRVLGDVSRFSRITPKEIEELVYVGGPETAAWQLYEDRQRGTKRGVLVTTAHLGNWEMLVFSFAALREPMSYLARPLDNPMIEKMTYRMRTRFGNRPINKTNAARPALRILRSGGILGALVDVNWTEKSGVFVPFFGVEACTTSGPAILALQSDALLFPLACVWDEELGKYRYIFGDAVEPVRTGSRENDIRETTARYTAEIEKLIRRYPEQWTWIHKRWKTRPPSETAASST